MSDRALLPVGVLASGRGSNFEAIVRASESGQVPARVVVLVSDRPDARALDVARRHGIETVVVERRDHPSREAHDKAVAGALDCRQVALVCLAGYMRILSADLVRHFHGRLLNIHPSLLPAFPGLHAQRQAIEHGVRVTGATVHFVDEGLDSGPIVLQAAVPVRSGDTEAALARRILVEEHRLYPEAIRLFAEGRLRIDGRRVHIAETGEGT
jgi:phosphoribosylglycinamide formyltransferase-1